MFLGILAITFPVRAEAEDFVFWRFLTLTEDASKPMSVCLATLAKMYTGSQKDVFKSHLLQAQVSSVHEHIFERLKVQGSLEFGKASIPKDLRTKHFMDEKRWLLGP